MTAPAPTTNGEAMTHAIPASADDGLSAFVAVRPRLFGIAYRLLGSASDAEDVVQDAWLRYARADTTGVADLRAWLTTVTGRLCLDHLRAAYNPQSAMRYDDLFERLQGKLPSVKGNLSGHAEERQRAICGMT